MYRHEEFTHKFDEYARAYILAQKYEDLYSCKEAFTKGTIFKVLYEPYVKSKNSECWLRGDVYV